MFGGSFGPRPGSAGLVPRGSVSDLHVENEQIASALNDFLSRNPNAPIDNEGEMMAYLELFIEQNSNPRTSPNFRRPEADNFESVLRMLGHQAMSDKPYMLHALMKTLKILSRKRENRARMNMMTVRLITNIMINPPSMAIASECANVLLNICYEKDNVRYVLESDGIPPLIAYLRSTDEDLAANAAGAIQSVCFQKQGKTVVRMLDGIPILIMLLDNANVRVRTRAVGALHNLSTDIESVPLIRDHNGLPPLVALLSADETAICGSAAGAIQNVSREELSRDIVSELGAVEPLTELLVGSDIATQVCAMGALLNICGPAFGPPGVGDGGESEKRKAFRQLLSLAISTGVAYHCLYDSDEEQDQVT